MAEGAGDRGEPPTGVKPGDAPVPDGPRKATLGDVLSELKRRHVFRVMVGYGVFAFAVLQVTEPLMHGLHLPEWVLTAVIAALAVGLPIAVILAWLYDLTSQGVKRTPSVPGTGTASFSRARLAWLLVGVGLVGTLPGVGWYAWRRTSERGPPATTPAAPPSIAVLPFTDLSPGKDPDYFADGVAEEILGALSRVAGLRVPARSSSFWFKGKSVEPAEIARKLGVNHLLEGSVRRSGSKLRIQAEVVKASTGERVWGETYERELTDVFAIQDEIARSVVRELAPVLLARNPPPPPTATTDPEAYRLFLLGRALNARSTPESLRHALEALERSAALDPRFAPTQAFLAVVRGGASMYERGDERDRLRKAGKEAAERAVALDPSSPQGYLARAWYRLRLELDWQGASEDIDRATAIEPGDEGVQNLRALLLASLGRTREAVEAERRSVDLSPLNAVHITNLALILVGDGKLGEAREWARRSLEISPANDRARNILGYVALLEGKPEEALAEFQKGMGSGAKAGTVAALHYLGREQESRDALVSLERNHGDEPVAIAGARAWRGDADGAFAALDRAVEERNVDLVLLNPHPLLRSLRGDPRWKKLLRKMNLPVE